MCHCLEIIYMYIMSQIKSAYYRFCGYNQIVQTTTSLNVPLREKYANL